MIRLKKFANNEQQQAVYEALRTSDILVELENSVKRNTELKLEGLEQTGEYAVESIVEEIAVAVSKDDEPYVSVSEYLNEHYNWDSENDNALERLIAELINEKAYELVDFDKVEEAIDETQDPSNYNGDNSDIRREYWQSR